MKILDCFSGIGGFRSGFTDIENEFVGFVDVDENARKSYRSVYSINSEDPNSKSYEKEFHDIRSVTEADLDDLSVDLVTGGFPCPAFSIAGKRLGFEDTRGTLFFDLMNVVKITNPKFVLAENVKGLVTHNKGETLKVIVDVFSEIGYEVETAVLNSKNFGIAQNRERIFLLGVRKDIYRESVLDKVSKHKNPIPMALDILEEVVPEKFFVTHEGRLERLGKVSLDPTISGKIVVVGNVSKTGYLGNNAFSPYGIIPTLTARDFKDPRLIIDPRYNNRLRKLTPREYWRLQGFTDEQFNLATLVNANSHLYKQAGNAVTVNVIKAINKELFKIYGDLMIDTNKNLSDFKTEEKTLEDSSIEVF